MPDSIIEAITTPRPDRRAWDNAVSQAARDVPNLSTDAVDRLLEELILLQGQVSPAGSQATGRLEMDQFSQSLQTVVSQLVRREIAIRQAAGAGSDVALEPTASSLTEEPHEVNVSTWSSGRIGAIAQLYHRTPTNEDVRNHLLHLLAFSHQPEAVQVWSDLLCDDPPEYRPGIGLAFGPLMQPGFAPDGDVLTKLLHHATAYPQVAPAVFDLFNYFYRTDRLENHPAAVRCEEPDRLAGRFGVADEEH